LERSHPIAQSSRGVKDTWS